MSCSWKRNFWDQFFKKKKSEICFVDLTSEEFAEDIDVGTLVVRKENYDE